MYKKIKAAIPRQGELACLTKNLKSEKNFCKINLNLKQNCSYETTFGGNTLHLDENESKTIFQPR